MYTYFVTWGFVIITKKSTMVSELENGSNSNLLIWHENWQNVKTKNVRATRIFIVPIFTTKKTYIVQVTILELGYDNNCEVHRLSDNYNLIIMNEFSINVIAKKLVTMLSSVRTTLMHTVIHCKTTRSIICSGVYQSVW